jgi:hypothetical protein
VDAASVTGDNTTSDLLQPPVMQVLSLMKLQGAGSAVKQRATSCCITLKRECNSATVFPTGQIFGPAGKLM